MSREPVVADKLDAVETLCDYLRSQYRPYGIADLVQNLHNAINKAATIKALDELAARGDVLKKTFGKSAYYVYKEKPLLDIDGLDPAFESCASTCAALDLLDERVIEAESETRNLEKRTLCASHGPSASPQLTKPRHQVFESNPADQRSFDS